MEKGGFSDIAYLTASSKEPHILSVRIDFDAIRDRIDRQMKTAA
jgi:hypothetical protein